MAEARRGRRAGALAVFISPVFATRSHAGARPLGVLHWQQLARAAGPASAALGGIAGARVRRLPSRCRAVGAIEVFVTV
jgi:thiamine-phosphate pyrophosphorylase